MRSGIDIPWKSFFILWAFILSAPGIGAQNETVNFSARRMTAKNMMVEIEQQTGYRFGFESSVFDTSHSVSLDRTDLPLGKALDKLVGNGGFEWAIHGKFIIITRKQDSGEKENKKTRGSGGGNPDAPAEPGRPPVHLDDPVGIGREPIIQGAVSPKTHSNLRPPARYLPPAITIPKPWALKTDLLYAGILLAPNIAVEMAVAGASTLGLSFGVNPWRTMGAGRRLRHWILRPEYRYWVAGSFTGHFFGGHLFYARYDVRKYDLLHLFDRKYAYTGWSLGAGVDYGYHLRLSKRWGLEFDLSIGLANFICRRSVSGDRVTEDPVNRIYFGPVRAGICLVFVSGRR